MVDDLKLSRKGDVYIKGRGKNKKSYRRVTSFVGSFFTPFDAKGMARKLSKLPWAKAQGKTMKTFLTEWKQSGEDGTEVHKLLEKYVLGELDITEETLAPIKAQQGFRWFDKYEEIIQPEMVLPERRVHSDKYLLAGTVDLCLHMQGNGVYVCDFKTNKDLTRTYNKDMGLGPCSDLADTKLNHYYLQLNIYAFLLETEYGYDVLGMKIVHLKEDGVVEYDVPNMRAKVLEMLNYEQ